MIADVPPDIVELVPSDFKRNRLRYLEPAPYDPAEFERTYEWMLRWDLIPEDTSFETLVDNRAVASS